MAAELERPVPDALHSMVAEIRRRHGAGVAAIVFYGSCLRTERYEDGVLDFYVLIDSYRAAYTSRLLAWANAALPPNVFYCEVVDQSRTLRSKYAVISTDDFECGMSSARLQTILWARFCQPALLAYARDAAARGVVIRAAAEATITMLGYAVALLADSRVRSDALWQRGFAETYRAELRVESADTVRSIYESAAERYDRVTAEALRELGRRGVVRVTVDDGVFSVAMATDRRRNLRRKWTLRRLLGKPLAAARLVKSMVTFGDWVPYALWKLERHSGVRIELTEWQRRHVWIACWPVIFRLLFRRVLR